MHIQEFIGLFLSLFWEPEIMSKEKVLKSNESKNPMLNSRSKLQTQQFCVLLAGSYLHHIQDDVYLWRGEENGIREGCERGSFIYFEKI